MFPQFKKFPVRIIGNKVFKYQLNFQAIRSKHRPGMDQRRSKAGASIAARSCSDNVHRDCG